MQKDDNKSIQNALTPHTANTVQQNAPAAGAQTEQRDSGPVGLAALVSGKRGVAPGGGSALAKALHLRFNEVMTANGDDHMGVILLDSQLSGTALSAVVVWHALASDATKVAFHTVMIDSSTDLPIREVHYQGMRMEIPSVAGDVYSRSDIFRNKVRELVKQQTRAQKLYNTGCTVIPVNLDKDDEAVFNNILHRATEATQNKIEKVQGIPGMFTLSKASPNDQVIGTLSTRDDKITDIVGHPIRSDVAISVQVTEANSKDIYNANTTALSRTDVFIDLMPRQRQTQNQFLMGQPQPQLDMIHYDPRVIIQAANTLNNAITLEQILLGVHSTSLLSYNGSWMSAFRPSTVKTSKVDLADIGAIGYEVNLTGDPAAKPAPLATKSAKFAASPENGDPLVQLLTATVSADLVYSMDIPQSGEISWLMKVFTAAAYTGYQADAKTQKARQKARQAIIDCANNLTGNRFGAAFPADQEICILEEAPIHVGHYTRDGEVRSLADLDYLAMLNLTGAHGTAAAHRYASTFAQTNVPWPQRLAERLQVMREVLPELKVTDYANRVTFTPQFLMALKNAIDATGLVLTPQNLYQETNGMFQPLNLAQYAVGSSQIQAQAANVMGGATVLGGAALI